MSSAVYGWIIVSQSIGEPARIGVYGPRNIHEKILERLKNMEGRAWRALDDDGEECYFGFYVGPDDHHMFGPLDDFAKPDAGATTIEYMTDDGQWQAL